MNIRHTLNGFDFVWDEKKARKNLGIRGISFEEACEVFFDPFYKMEDASRHGEERRGNYRLFGIRSDTLCRFSGKRR